MNLLDNFCLWLYDKFFYLWNNKSKIIFRKPKEILLGYNYDEVFDEWVSLRFDGEHIVILHDINLSSKPVAFWDNIPDTRRIIFSKDIIVLRCKDLRQVQNIVYSVEKEFAVAYGYKNGKRIIGNYEY